MGGQTPRLKNRTVAGSGMEGATGIIFADNGVDNPSDEPLPLRLGGGSQWPLSLQRRGHPALPGAGFRALDGPHRPACGSAAAGPARAAR